ncbi:hypothetical protein VNO77_38841 [Canavalia gladiata]|uniref:Uncharacterized protein n=1 Tax=Canavalia gladiata TaxID=3824 RepID=A0AAN9KBL3_CANGL
MVFPLPPGYLAPLTTPIEASSSFKGESDPHMPLHYHSSFHVWSLQGSSPYPRLYSFQSFQEMEDATIYALDESLAQLTNCLQISNLTHSISIFQGSLLPLSHCIFEYLEGGKSDEDDDDDDDVYMHPKRCPHFSVEDSKVILPLRWISLARGAPSFSSCSQTDPRILITFTAQTNRTPPYGTRSGLPRHLENHLGQLLRSFVKGLTSAIFQNFYLSSDQSEAFDVATMDSNVRKDPNGF